MGYIETEFYGSKETLRKEIKNINYHDVKDNHSLEIISPKEINRNQNIIEIKIYLTDKNFYVILLYRLL